MNLVVLVGAPASGKSAVAAELSRFGWRVWESDDAAGAALNTTRAEAYLAERGEEFASTAARLVRERLAQLTSPKVDGSAQPSTIAAAPTAAPAPAADLPNTGKAGAAGAAGEVLVVSSEAVDDAAVRAELARVGAAGGNVVHLDADLASLTRRLGFTAPGGLAPLTPRALLGQMRRERLPLYQEVATVNLNTSFLTVPEVAAQVLATLS